MKTLNTHKHTSTPESSLPSLEKSKYLKQWDTSSCMATIDRHWEEAVFSSHSSFLSHVPELAVLDHNWPDVSWLISGSIWSLQCTHFFFFIKLPFPFNVLWDYFSGVGWERWTTFLYLSLYTSPLFRYIIIYLTFLLLMKS